MSRERMSSVDTAWLRMDSDGNLMMIVGVHVFDTPITVARLRRLLEERLLVYPRFRQRVETDPAGAWWVDDDRFSLDHHLKRVSLGRAAGDAELQALAGRLASEPLDPTRPLWQFHLVGSYRGGCALVTRIHHCIADGMALVGVLLSLTDERGTAPPAGTPRAAAEDGPHAAHDHEHDTGWDSFLRPLTQGAIKAIEATGVAVERSLEAVANPEKLADYAAVGAQVARDALKIALMSADSATSLKGVPGGRKAVAWNDPLPLDEVKSVGRALGASVNDVLLSCVAGALRRYLIARGEPVDGCEIRAMVPVNLRRPQAEPTLGNKFGLVPLVLPIGIGNPLARLREVRRRMEDLKGGYQALLAFALLGIVGRAPRVVQSQVLNILARKGTAVMTNVPGPSKALHMAGANMSRIMFWVPQSGDIGMGVSILSYDGGVQFGVITDRRLCEEPQKIIDGFAPEFERLVLTLALVPQELFADGDWDPDAIENQLFDRLARRKPMSGSDARASARARRAGRTAESGRDPGSSKVGTPEEKGRRRRAATATGPAVVPAAESSRLPARRHSKSATSPGAGGAVAAAADTPASAPVVGASPVADAPVINLGDAGGPARGPEPANDANLQMPRSPAPVVDDVTDGDVESLAPPRAAEGLETAVPNLAPDSVGSLSGESRAAAAADTGPDR